MHVIQRPTARPFLIDLIVLFRLLFWMSIAMSERMSV
ncbi:uncharacterized protein J3R85_009683 [Psidium guajava]|nr:uncharacterized protein J3R85_009683 [Psidium guajava]